MAATAMTTEASSVSLLDLDLSREIKNNNINILTCGDGDLSYSSALVGHVVKIYGESCVKVVATCFLEGDELHKIHPEAQSNIREIENLGGEVRTGIDATKLHDIFQSNYYHRIVWNFPQHPERRKIHLHRELLRCFFESARQCIHEEGEIWVSLKGGQGGSKAELNGFQRPWSNSWQVQEQAALSGLVLASVGIANIDSLEQAGYRSVGFRGSDRSFFTKGSLTHRFTFPGHVKHVSPTKSIMHPLVYRHDISFWVNEAVFTEKQFTTFLTAFFEPRNIDFCVEQFDSYQCPKTNRTSRGYHVDMWSDSEAISKPITGELMREISLSLADGFDEGPQGSAGGAQGRYQFDMLPEHCKPKKPKQGQ